MTVPTGACCEAGARTARRSRGECPVRVVEYRLDDPSDVVYRLATTLFDPAAAPAAEIAALYHERWEVETAYDEVKTHILGPGAILRSKTPDLVLQEVTRPDAGALCRAASDPRGGAQGSTRTRIVSRSSMRCGSCVAVSRTPAFPPSSPNDRLRDRVLDEILEERVVSSRGQKKPRGVKRKMSGYPLRGPGPLG